MTVAKFHLLEHCFITKAESRLFRKIYPSKLNKFKKAGIKKVIHFQVVSIDFEEKNKINSTTDFSIFRTIKFYIFHCIWCFILI